jgi:hypothetical protein
VSEYTVDSVTYDAKANTVRTEDGRIWNITGWFDVDGDECAPDDAHVFTAMCEGVGFIFHITRFTQVEARLN